MSNFICEKCGCIDNSACGGTYWNVLGRMNLYQDEYANTHMLCVECTPTMYRNGVINPKVGKWHNIFPKKHWSEYGTREQLIEDCKEGIGNVTNAIDYFNTIAD